MPRAYGYRTEDGQVFRGLTFEQAIKMQQEEDAKIKAREDELKSSASLGPQVSAGIREFERQRQQVPETGGAMAGVAEPVPASGQGAANLGDQSFSNAVDTAVAEQQQQPSGQDLTQETSGTDALMQNLGGGGGAMEQVASPGAPGSQPWEGFTAEQQAGIEQGQERKQRQMSAPMMSLFKGVPDEVADDLIAQYRMGTLKPNAFIKQITDIKKTLRGAEAEEKKLSFESKLKREETALTQDAITDRTRMNIASTEKLAEAERKGQYSLPEGIDPLTNLSARELAYQLGKSKGAKDVYPDVIALLQAGHTINEARDTIRLRQQSEEFNEVGRPALHQIFAAGGKSGKTVDLAFDAFDDLLQKGDMEGAKQYIKRAAQNSYPVETGKQLYGKERTVEFLAEIRDDLEEFERKGGNTNIFEGTKEDVAKALGLVANEELRTIATKVNTVLQAYRKSMTGVAFGKEEGKEYKAMFPDISKTGTFNMATLTALDEVFSGDVAHLYKNAMGEKAYNTFVLGNDTETEGAPGTTVDITNALTSEQQSILDQYAPE
jgi:hypothetical protein